MDDWFARAAEKTYVSCDELVATEVFHAPEEARYVHWERSQTTGVVPIAGGAHPTSCTPLYGFDVPHFKEYTGSAKEGGFAAYAEKYIVDKTEEDYQNLVGGLDAIRNLPIPTY